MLYVLQGMDPTKQKEVDDKMKELDGTDNKAKLGGKCYSGSFPCSVEGAYMEPEIMLHLQSRKIAVFG